MAKKVDTFIKLQVPAGQANPSPPVGPALGAVPHWCDPPFDRFRFLIS